MTTGGPGGGRVDGLLSQATPRHAPFRAEPTRPPVRLAFISATPRTVSAGSGTAVAIRGLQQGLEALGHHVRVVAPPWRRVGPLYALRRWWFNQRVRVPTDAEVVVGFDLDGYAVAPRTAVPYVSVIYGQLADEARFERGATRVSMQWQARLEKLNAARADLVIAASAYSARRLAEGYGVPPHRIAVVPPAFDVGRWQHALTVIPARPRVRPTVLAVARLYPRKNLAALIAAAVPLSHAIPDVEIRIVGDGPERRRLRAATRRAGVRGTVRLLGHVAFPQLVEEFRSADVFCLPSLQEGFGLVYLEAMAAGLPIVATRASSTPELIVHEVNGLLADPGDPARLAAALQTLLLDPARCRAIAERNRTEVERYAPPRVARAFLEAIGPYR